MTLSFAILLNIWEVLIHPLSEKYPNVLALGAFGFIVWFSTNRWDRFYGRFKKTEDRCNTILDFYLPDLHAKFVSIDRKLNSLIVSVHKISTYLITSAGLDSRFFEGESPLQLTELGDSILKKSGGKAYINKFLDDLIKAIEIKEPKSRLDVQNYSNSVLTERSLEDDFTQIKNWVYENPTFNINTTSIVNTDLDMIIQIMSIYLRNKALEVIRVS